mgnify:CR=1 FL=1
MTLLDWIVLGATLLVIVVYGTWQTRSSNDMKGYLLGNREARWFTVALSIMATQASAITFLSAPGQAYIDGMRFVQFYFGLPLAMVVLSITVVPIYHRLNVYTAYEFLEKRFDLKTRLVAAILFLTQRGLAAGFTIFAPSLIFSSLLGWDITITNIVIGVLVITYTVAGGTKAVNQTQKYQMAIILLGMLVAGVMVVVLMPPQVSFTDAMYFAGKMGRLNAVELDFDLSSRYNIWSGLIGGLFLALSYFGTDQSQVQRYLSGSSVTQSRLGLLFNAMVKIPMQFAILFIGAMVYVFYFFNQPPVFFNKVLVEDTRQSAYAEEFQQVQEEYSQAFFLKKNLALELATELDNGESALAEEKMNALVAAEQRTQELRESARLLIEQANPDADTNDTNYIFLTFVINYLPAGLVGLLIAVIFSASMSSTSSELNALASTSIVDIYKRVIKKDGSEQWYVLASKFITVFWGLYAIVFSLYANRLGTLIEAVNILGSLVYGTILGIFMVAFYFKRVGSNAVFIAAIVTEVLIIYCWVAEVVPYLWFNVIGCLGVIIFALLLQLFIGQEPRIEQDIAEEIE